MKHRLEYEHGDALVIDVNEQTVSIELDGETGTFDAVDDARLRTIEFFEYVIEDLRWTGRP